MRGFAKPRQTTVTLTRDDESVTLHLTAPRFNVIEMWRETLKEELGTDEVGGSLGFIVLALALGDQVETRPMLDARPGRDVAAAIKAELADAHLSDADVLQLLLAVQALINGPSKEVTEAAKNSKAPAGAGE